MSLFMLIIYASLYYGVYSESTAGYYKGNRDAESDSEYIQSMPSTETITYPTNPTIQIPPWNHSRGLMIGVGVAVVAICSLMCLYITKYDRRSVHDSSVTVNDERFEEKQSTSPYTNVKTRWGPRSLLNAASSAVYKSSVSNCVDSAVNPPTDTPQPQEELPATPTKKTILCYP
ncbi:hypothetical protein BDB01DRAFT_576149 [Pilobolus umbonatus]|nr:hypothetical protein BDB01DRAFT_576149 [Pilobolus umbonatus]